MFVPPQNVHSRKLGVRSNLHKVWEQLQKEIEAIQPAV
jgi:hypothetical protein